MKDNIETLVVIICFIMLIGLSFGFVGILSQINQDKMTKNLCEQYNSVPIEHLDRIPTACTAEYFSHER